MALNDLIVRQPAGLQAYTATYAAMLRFTRERDVATLDELWLLQHPPLFTQGLNGKAEHLLTTGAIPVVATDRGGQVTYHGPGQLVAYPLIDLTRKKIGVKEFVRQLEQALIDLLADYQITAERRENAPGVYVNGAKIASLGLRIKQGRSYHGLSLNVAMDLAPFKRIVPCGLSGIEVTQLSQFAPQAAITTVAQQLTTHLSRQLDAHPLL